MGLTLLEVIRNQDLPTEILESEDPSVTMPRRLGLSEVVDRQIRMHREAVRRGRRMSDEEMRDLVRLVIRRPDSEDVFYRAGAQLAHEHGEEEPRSPGWTSVLPRTLGLALARRRAGKRLKRLLGRRFGGFGAGPFSLEARAHIFIQSDPGGDACFFVTGLCQSVVQSQLGPECKVAHSLCQARGDAFCKWTVMAEEKVREPERASELILGLEPEGA